MGSSAPIITAQVKGVVKSLFTVDAWEIRIAFTASEAAKKHAKVNFSLLFLSLKLRKWVGDELTHVL